MPVTQMHVPVSLHPINPATGWVPPLDLQGGVQWDYPGYEAIRWVEEPITLTAVVSSDLEERWYKKHAAMLRLASSAQRTIDEKIKNRSARLDFSPSTAYVRMIKNSSQITKEFSLPKNNPATRECKSREDLVDDLLIFAMNVLRDVDDSNERRKIIINSELPSHHGVVFDNWDRNVKKRASISPRENKKTPRFKANAVLSPQGAADQDGSPSSSISNTSPVLTPSTSPTAGSTSASTPTIGEATLTGTQETVEIEKTIEPISPGSKEKEIVKELESRSEIVAAKRFVPSVRRDAALDNKENEPAARLTNQMSNMNLNSAPKSNPGPSKFRQYEERRMNTRPLKNIIERNLPKAFQPRLRREVPRNNKFDRNEPKFNARHGPKETTDPRQRFSDQRKTSKSTERKPLGEKKM